MKKAIQKRLEVTENALDKKWKEETKDIKEFKGKRTPIYSKDSKVYLLDEKNKMTDETTKIGEAYPKAHGLVEYYYGLRVKEYEGS